MPTTKLALKLFAADGTLPSASRFVATFHDWIRRDALGELLIDVVDYGHVHHGPAVLLVGHESDYALDLAEGRPGLRYQRKRVAADASERAVADGTSRLLRAARLLEQELEGLRFDTSGVQLELLDRLRTPNDAATLASVRGELERVASRWFGDPGVVTNVSSDPRQPLTLRLSGASAPSLVELGSRVS